MLCCYDEEGEEHQERRGMAATGAEVKHLLFLQLRAKEQRAAYDREEQKQQFVEVSCICCLLSR